MNKPLTAKQKAQIYRTSCLCAYVSWTMEVLKPHLANNFVLVSQYSILVLAALAGMTIVTEKVIANGNQYCQWRTVMKRNFSAWFTILVCSISFVVLMVEICKHVGNVYEAIIVVVTASVLFIPNMWALPKVLFSKKEQDR